MRDASGGSVRAQPEDQALERRVLRWSDLGIRVVSACVLAPIALACIWLGGTAFILLVTAVALGLAVEWLMLCRLPTARRGGAALRAAGFAYVALAGAALLFLRADPVAGRANVVFLVLIVWAGDVGAYLFGRLLGGPRLAPHISPGKTWSGALGGLLTAIAVALVAAHFQSGADSQWDGEWGWQWGWSWRAALVGAGIGIVAQAGDLLESFVKRRLEVKDSSHLIPGHGGLFDRLDAVLSSALAAGLLALALGRGVVLWQ
jgi:phosphatidate cytidylyltransferase